jgi:hypothetical protein
MGIYWRVSFYEDSKFDIHLVRHPFVVPPHVYGRALGFITFDFPSSSQHLHNRTPYKDFHEAT